MSVAVTVIPPTNPSRDELILMHMPQVRYLAGRLHGRCPACVELDDLVSVGTLGLIWAVDRFRPERGCQLKTLADHRIRGAMLDYLRAIDPLPRSLRSFVRRRRALVDQLGESLGRQPQESEIAGAMNISINRYRKLVWSIRAANTRSLEEIVRR
jgi:RNA polymerase sigma factor FliA